MPCFSGCDREWFFYDDIAARAHRKFCERSVRVIWTRNYDEVDVVAAGECFWILYYIYFWKRFLDV